MGSNEDVGVLKPILLPIFASESPVRAAANQPLRGVIHARHDDVAPMAERASLSAFARIRNEFIERCGGKICQTVAEGVSLGLDESEAEEMVNIHALWEEQEGRMQRTMQDIQNTADGEPDGDSEAVSGIDPHYVLVMTVPKHALCPSACTLNEFNSTEDARGYKRLLMALMYLAYNVFFYDYRFPREEGVGGGDESDGGGGGFHEASGGREKKGPKRKRGKNEHKVNMSRLLDDFDNRRVRVYMEYIMGEDFNPGRDRPSFISALGIRFHFAIFGDEIMLIESLENYIEDNGVVKMPMFSKRIKQGSPASASAMATPHETPMTVFGANDWKRLMHSYAVSTKVDGGNADGNDADDDEDDVPSEAATTRLDSMGDQDLGDCTRLRENMRIIGRMGLPGVGHALAVERVLSLENSRVEGMHSAQRQHPHRDWKAVSSRNGGPAAYRFAFPSCVFEIRHPYTAPVAVLSYSLPYTFDWVDRRDQQDILEDSRRLQNRDLLVERFRCGNFVRRNDLRELKREIEEDLARVEKNAEGDPALMPDAIRAFRARSMRAFCRVWNENSMISDPTVRMLRYLRRKRLQQSMSQYTDGRLPSVLDPQLSWFGNMMAQLMHDFEFALQTSVTHRELLILFVACFDAYRYEMNLHLNILLLGPGGKGKSRMLELIEEILIPDTCFAVTHSTRKANTSDEDNNDHISLFSEMPNHKLGLDTKGANGGGETGDPIEKERLTSCRVKTKTLYVDHDNMRRLTKTTESECVGVELGASNESFAKLGEAQFSRYLPIMVNDYDRPGFNVVNKITALDVYRGERKAAKQDLVERMRLLQYQCNLVNKLVFMGILPKIDESVPKTMFNACFEYMRREGIIFGTQETTRVVKKLLMFARTLTIMRACSKYFNDPRSPAYGLNGKFEPERDLLGIAPLLFCCEEIAYFTMTLLKHTFMNEHFVIVTGMIMRVFGNDFVHEEGMDDMYVVNESGYCSTRAEVITSVEAMAHRLHGAQTMDDGAVILSKENIHGTLSDMRRTSLGGKPLLTFEKVRVNGSFGLLDAYRRKSLKFDATDMLHEVFQAAYAHKHMKPRTKVLSGGLVSKQHPFLFNTVEFKANPGRTMAMLNQDAWCVEVASGGEFKIEDDFEKRQHDNFWRAYRALPDQLPFQGWKHDGHDDLLASLPSDNIPQQCLGRSYPDDQIEAMRQLYGVEKK